ncbi:unnamed protein product, partial [Rotaria socialis]
PSNKSDTQNDSTINNDQKSSSHQVISLTQLILSLDIEQWETLVDVQTCQLVFYQIYTDIRHEKVPYQKLQSHLTYQCVIIQTHHHHPHQRQQQQHTTTSTTHYSAYHSDNNSKQSPLLDTTEHTIKLEEEIPQPLESFIILPDNEIEQMIIGDNNNEQTNEEIVHNIIEQIKNQIVQSSSATIVSSSNQITQNFSIDTQDIHKIIGSIMNRMNENDHEESLSSTVDNKIEENVNTNLEDETTPMESDQPATNLSRSRIDDDIVELEETPSNDNSHTCTCRCHKPNSPHNNEYIQFEQALKQARLEQQQERSLNNNRLIQTLKRQHEELLNIYQQNKSLKQFNLTKIDREQQTTKLSQNDSQVQTDLTPINNNKLLAPKQQKSLIIPIIGSHTSNNNNNNGPLLATRNNSVYNSISSLPQVASRLSSNAIATTTLTSKTSTVTIKSATVTNGQAITSNPLAPPPPLLLPPPPLLLSTTIPHDVVDLTEEDEDDTMHRLPAQRITATRQSTSFIQPSIPTTTTLTPAATATATRIRSTTATATSTTINRTIRPNTSLPNGQVVPLRPLPEHNPCDHTIARPQLNIAQENTTVRLTWNLQSTPMESIQNYEIYAYKQNAALTASDWKKIGTVKSMRLPMAVTLKEFQSNSHYAFAVRAVSINNNIGPFCEPKTIFTGNTPVQPLHTSQLLNVST